MQNTNPRTLYLVTCTPDEIIALLLFTLTTNKYNSALLPPRFIRGRVGEGVEINMESEISVMSFINQDILKSFVQKNSWITAATEPEGLAETILQVDDIISLTLQIPVPADPADARPILRNIACALTVWYGTGQQGTIDSAEYQKRKTQYDNAMATLELIAQGSIKLDNGEEGAKPTSVFKSDTPAIVKL